MRLNSTLAVFFALLFSQLHMNSLQAQQFIEVGAAANVDLDRAKDGGVAWGDFNQDGFLDLLVNTDHGVRRSRLYLSDGNPAGPSFTDVSATHAQGLINRLCERSAVWADINNDGYLDFARNGNDRFEIYLNKGPTATPPYSFGTATQDPNLSITNVPNGMNTEGFGWVDYNQDGWLDLVFDNHNFGIDIYENPADGTANFFHVTPNGSTMGLPTGARTGDYMAISDYNNDGNVDFLVRKENDFDIWINNGPAATPQFSAHPGFNLQANNGNKGGVLFADFDNDGDFDLFWSDNDGNQIFLQDAAGNFAPSGEPAASSGVAPAGVDGVAAADVDHDGRIDLFCSTNSGAGQLYLNQTPPGGPLTFTIDNLGINLSANGEGCAFGDYDNDGDLDLYVNIDDDDNQLYRNGLNNNNFLKVRAERTVGPGIVRADIGATVVLKDCNGNIRSGIRDVNGTRGHGSQDGAEIHFGLPDGPTAIYVVEISFTTVNGVRNVVQTSVIPASLSGQTLVVNAADASDLSFCTPLPASPFTLLSVKYPSSGLDLIWDVEREEGLIDYRIERSRDGFYFEEIGVTTARPISGAAYRFHDAAPLSGNSWYRIRQNQQGLDAFSEKVRAIATSRMDFAIKGNPVLNGTLHAELYLPEAQWAEFRLSDTDGKLIEAHRTEFAEGLHPLQWSVQDCPAGLYFLQVNSPQGTLVRKILISGN